MDIELFSKIVKKLGDSSLDDFSCKYNGKIYGFKEVGEDKWNDEGKYQYKEEEEGQLIEMDENYKEIQEFNFGVSRSISRCGSYFTDYNYTYEPYDMFEIKDELIPEVIIPAHVDKKWSKLDIDLEKVIDEKEEKLKQIESERIRLEEEKNAEEEKLRKLYPMNKRDIIKIAADNLKKKGGTFTIKDMRKEYYDIVVKKKLESQEWIDYHSDLKN